MNVSFLLFPFDSIYPIIGRAQLHALEDIDLQVIKKEFENSEENIDLKLNESSFISQESNRAVEVGDKVSVYWPTEKWSFRGTVKETNDPKYGSHIIVYEDVSDNERIE